MQFDTSDLTPWADFLRIMQNARGLVVQHGDETLDGLFDMDIDDDGLVTIAFQKAKTKKIKR